MRSEFLTLAILFTALPSALRAGTVVTLSSTPETSGKLSFTDSGIHVDSGSPSDISLSDVLEADFSDAPFHLDTFTTAGSSGSALPAGWKSQQMGAVTTPGSVAYADGVFTLTGDEGPPETKSADKKKRAKEWKQAKGNIFFVGQPWTGNGQWTARLTSVDPASSQTVGGLALLDSLDPESPMVEIEAGTLGFGTVEFRGIAGKPRRGMGQFTMELPVWLRLTRYGPNVDAAMSSDGKAWVELGQGEFEDAFAQPWIGLFVDSRSARGAGRVVADQVSFTPTPCADQVTPPGVILQSGSFLAGFFDRLSLDPAAPETDGQFERNGKRVAIPPSKVAEVTLLPTSPSQFASAGAQVGVLMKNNDFTTGTFQDIFRNDVRLNSELLGPATYTDAEARACLLQPVQPQPAPYEVRLRDGSIIRATGVQLVKDGIEITDVSGITIDAAPEEIAQFRAGSAQAQSLLEFPWKATPPAAPANAAHPAPAAPATPAAPAANAAPPAPPAECWEGNNAQHILCVSTGTTVDFPLTGKFHEMAMSIAVVPGSALNAQASVRILADGREIARTPSFRAGDEPRFMQITLQQPHSLTLQVESLYAGTKVLLIDPVLLRAN